MTNIDHFKVHQCDVHLLQLRMMCKCKLHYRIWGMRGLYLIANVMRKKKEQQEIIDVVNSMVGDRFGKKLKAEDFLNHKIKLPQYVDKITERSSE